MSGSSFGFDAARLGRRELVGVLRPQFPLAARGDRLVFLPLPNRPAVDAEVPGEFGIRLDSERLLCFSLGDVHGR